jgi:hypothetical protein
MICVWRMAYGVWRMAYGVWRMAPGCRKIVIFPFLYIDNYLFFFGHVPGGRVAVTSGQVRLQERSMESTMLLWRRALGRKKRVSFFGEFPFWVNSFFDCGYVPGGEG